MKRTVIYTESNANLIEDVCKFLYSEKGIQSIHDSASVLNLDYSYCDRCEVDNPIISRKAYSCCAVCGNNIEL